MAVKKPTARMPKEYRPTSKTKHLVNDASRALKRKPSGRPGY